ncbi:MAG: efflux RND transporter permease subunit [Candidatus Competibacterales bacterium]
MNGLIDWSLAHSRTVLALLGLILVSGTSAYLTIPKESEPDVAIPFVMVVLTHEGIAAEDAERLLVKPMERELKGIEGLKELTASAGEGYAHVMLEFEAGFDPDRALVDVREQVDIAKVELPEETDEPQVEELNVALFPVLVVTLSGQVDERLLVRTARDLRDQLEALPGILEVEIAGDREDVLEAVIDPEQLEAFGLSYEEMITFVRRNNQLVAAGTLDSGEGRFPIQVPGVIEDLEDMLTTPVKVSGERLVMVGDVAAVRRTFKDPEGFARVNGRPAIALEVKKRIGAHIVDTLDRVRAVVAAEQATWEAPIQVGYSQDKSEDVRDMLKDLQNNVIAAVVLVMIVVIATLGLAAAGLVGVAIPGAFLAGILVLQAGGLTVNIVVLFSLIMAVGMLVDGAIVVVEYAARRMAEGASPAGAYGEAAKQMAWPIIAATATTLAAFMPLLFWPGMIGEFMKYLPITLIATLSASLLMALIFVPCLGAVLAKGKPRGGAVVPHQGWLVRGYLRLLAPCLQRPLLVSLAAVVVLVGMYDYYGKYGHGVEFFPDIEPENALVYVRARGDLSVVERDAAVREVEAKLLDMPALVTVYARSGIHLADEGVPEDAIGVIQLELAPWDQRPPAKVLFAELRRRFADLAGVVIELRRQEEGPAEGKPIQVQLSAREAELLPAAVAQVRRGLLAIGGTMDITDSRPLPGIQWQIRVDRAEAARFGADIATVGSAVQLVTNGITVGTYRPADSIDEVDIRMRFPATERGLFQFERLRIPTDYGPVPVANFVAFRPMPQVGILQRSDGRRVMTVEAEVADGFLADDRVQALRRWLGEHPLDPRIEVVFKGEDADQREAGEFLMGAFAVALFVMGIILVTQFNSFYQAFLILSAVVFSTVGVLLGLLVTAQPFGIVMCGIGVIALAGIVVNNNIVLIDTYNGQRRAGLEPREAILTTAAQRLRPVLLTTVTTVLGLMPMVLGVNIDFVTREVSVGAPSTQWWTQLATAVAGGLSFATLFTLVLTPCLLALGARCREGWGKWAPKPQY